MDIYKYIGVFVQIVFVNKMINLLDILFFPSLSRLQYIWPSHCYNNLMLIELKYVKKHRSKFIYKADVFLDTLNQSINQLKKIEVHNSL